MTNGTSLLLAGILLVLLSGLWLIWVIARRSRTKKERNMLRDAVVEIFPKGIDLNATLELDSKPKAIVRAVTKNFHLVYNEVVVHSSETIE